MKFNAFIEKSEDMDVRESQILSWPHIRGQSNEKCRILQTGSRMGQSRVGMYDAAVLEIAARMQRLLRHHEWEKK